ncbi:SDR family NAD(P)-dependent oxidoreductase [Actinomadura verrucosospora]|uniref:Short-chain dehydrogenase/reductase SDR n=1 Tax=Actinomadura verrucosospora TaxID=46165 RepID=A0A7D4A6U0_ACTVE|nr:SDR family oxidoreductase [Actinomadura verrucosospora]QKG26624.1 short-chain dehydrogenase/reductase SDR [Actinomadura verrucosospora]
MDLGLTGRVAMVAAATSGLGLAAARELAAAGADVAICGRDPDRLDRAAAEIDKAGPGRTVPTRLDVLDHDAAAAWADRTAIDLGGPHVLVTNAGGPPGGPVLGRSLDDFRAAVELSVLSHVALVQAALPHMRDAGWGRVLMIASETMRQPTPRYGLSSTVRPALAGFARTLVRELGPAGITVNVLAPGYHRTPAVASMPDLDEVAASIPLGRLGRPSDFGAVAAFLAGEQAGFITGTTLVVDGGLGRGI